MSRGPNPRRSVRLSRTVVSCAVLLAVTLSGSLMEPPSASAASIRRTWTTEIGSGGRNGSIVLRAYLDGTGALLLDLTGLEPSTAYPLIIYRGSCASPKTIARFTSSVSSSSGTIARVKPASSSQMNAIWSVARTGTIAVKVGSGRLARCGVLEFERATRIAIPSLKIDLPVMTPPAGYPPCNVAMYLQELSQPRERGVTFLYAHARKGMFLPLLDRSKVNNGASLIGMRVQVWTTDSALVTYRITQVRRHVTSLGGVLGLTSEQLWIQTSEGPRGTVAKLIVVAKRVSTGTASAAAAHPTPRPVACG